MKLRKKVFILRIKILGILLLLVPLVIFARLYDLQIVKHDYYATKANRQYSTFYEYYDRGTIYFLQKNNSKVAVASIKEGNVLAINPKLLDNPDELYNFLSKDLQLDIDYEKFILKARKKDDPYEEILSRIDREMAQKIKEKKIKGVLLPIKRWRFYPDPHLAPQTIGFVARNSKDPEVRGRYGIEASYDKVLYRDPNKLGVNFFAELLGNIKEALSFDTPQGSVVSSIEPNVQKKLQNVVKQTYDKWNSKRVSAIVYNPQNGEIVAMASYPDFNLNEFYKEKNPNIFSNPLVENVYEMGSIVKAITVASGLDSGAITENSTYNDTGSVSFDGFKIYNYDKRARGENTPVQEILSQSLNVGAAWVYTKLGKEKFREYFEKLGLLEESGVDLPNEASPIVGNLYSPRDIEYATASFGQGVAFTPVAMVRALGALGTGYIRQPHVVKEIILDNGLHKKIDYTDFEEKVFDNKTVEIISRMLTEVVDTKLDNGKRKKEHYSVAAKTGTAQIAKPGGGYFKDKYNHTFFGYFPAFEPRFLILFINEEPKGAKYASQTLTDSFYEMVDFLINYYNIEPDR